MRKSTLVRIAILGFAGTCAAASAQSNAPAWNPATPYSTGDLVQVNHNVYRAIASPAAGIDPTTNYNYWELANVRYSLTLNIGVGQTFPTFAVAWKYALNSVIGQSALLRMSIVTAGGNYMDSPTKQVSLDHPFGARIAIGGDNPAKVAFDFETTNGFVIDTGHSIASLSGISITTVNANGNSVALVASSNATLPSITNLNFQGLFHSYVLASSGAQVNFVSNDTFHGNYDTLISADGGTVTLPANTFLSGGSANKYGIYATHGAQVYVGAGSSIVNNPNANVFADSGSFVRIDGCNLSGSTWDIQASHGTSVSATGANYSQTSIDSTSNLFTS